MNNSTNPFVPRGSLLEQKNKSRSRFKTAFFFVLAVNIIPIAIALLMQGCRKQQADEVAIETNTVAEMPFQPTNPPPEMPGVSTNVMGALPPEHVAVPPVTSPTEYVVVRNDNFTTIGKKFGVSVRQIQDANPGIDPNKLQIGQKLQIPPPTAPTPAPSGTPDGLSAGGEQIYVVKSGDTLTKIANDHGTTVRAIREANNLQTDRIIVGQKLKLPAKAAAAPAQ